MEPISNKYRDSIVKMLQFSQQSHSVGEENVFQEGNKNIVPLVDRMIEENLQPGSGILNIQHLEELLAHARDGKACLLLPEHYSNFDLPVLCYLLRKAGASGKEIADALIAIAGIKLNEGNSAVLAFTEAYTRIVVVPSRSLEIIQKNIKDPKELVAEMYRSASINRASMKALNHKKKEGYIVLVFPSGTRYRPWDPSSKRGVREIDSYIKSFDYMCLLAIHGNILRINPSGSDMDEDFIASDKIMMEPSPVIDTSKFRHSVKDEAAFREDKKQMIVDEVMKKLEEMHISLEERCKAK